MIHRTGNIYKLDDEDLYILAAVDSEAYQLISLKDGNRWSNPLRVGTAEHNELDEEQFSDLTGHSFNFELVLKVGWLRGRAYKAEGVVYEP